jgi:hypothetical protein
MSPLQRCAALYALLAGGVVLFGYLPGVTDADGRMLGLFFIDPIDDLVHGLTALVAAICAWHSARWSRVFLWAFCLLYGCDILTGLLLQRGTLDLTVFTQPGGYPDIGLTNLALNLPHVGLVALAGWFLWCFRLSR